MRVVVADASPVHYLILIDRVELLRSLFGAVIMPPEVRGVPDGGDSRIST